MMGDLVGVIRDAGATMEKDFLHYLVTRHDTNDRPQAQIVALLRHLFADDVLMPTAIQSTAIEAAGLGKRTIYELEAGEISRATLKRARESMDDVNAAIMQLIQKSWGRGMKKKSIVSSFGDFTSQSVAASVKPRMIQRVQVTG